MAVKSFRPLTPSGRYVTISSFAEITKTKPERSLVEIRKKTGGRNAYGRMTSRGIGGGAKQKHRLVDFKRQRKAGIEAKVIAIEYDPLRTSRLALLEYKDGEKAYVVAPNGLSVGTTVMSGPDALPEIGNSIPLKSIPVGLPIHNIELIPGKGSQIVRSAGTSASVMSKDGGYVLVRLPSGEIRKVKEDCYATIGQVGNTEHENIVLGKAGRSRHRGIRGKTRAVAKNPVDHPMGGGQGKTAGGGHPVTPWGVITKGYKTRATRKRSDRFILVRRDGRPMKIR